MARSAAPAAPTPEPGSALARLFDFIDASPSPFHACETAAATLRGAGFEPVDERSPWPAGPGARFVQRGGSLVAWVGDDRFDPREGFRIVGAHTDSPNLRLKPHPDTGRAGYRQLAVEVYGGALLNSWLDRDLGLSGRLVVRGADGPEERLVLLDRAVARVPQLAIHLDREIGTKGLQLNAQQHLVPVWGLGERRDGDVLALVAEAAGIGPAAVLAFDLMLHDLAPCALVGADGDLVSAPRLDNLCSSWAAIDALVAVHAGDAAGRDRPGPVPLVVLFDHEEVGSVSDRGAASELVPALVERIVLGAGGDREALLRALARSLCLSADMAHATHPNYADRHEPDHQIALGGGPVLKVNANLRYASDAPGIAHVVLACEQAGVPLQRYAHRSDLPCGSTIGPVTSSRLGVTTVDVGAPQLAMHSAREMGAAGDPAMYRAMMGAFLAPE